jgi:hypothetical protein
MKKRIGSLLLVTFNVAVDADLGYEQISPGHGASLHFSHQLGTSGLRISESRCAAATLAIEGRSPDADGV